MSTPSRQQEEENAAIEALLNAVGTCPTSKGGLKRRGGGDTRGQKRTIDAIGPVESKETSGDVQQSSTASAAPTPLPFAIGTAPKKGVTKQPTRTSIASGVLADKTAGFVNATRDLAGAVVADNLFAAAGVTTVSIINPSAAGQALALLRTGVGGLLGCVTPTLITAVIVGFGLMKLVGPYISFSDILTGASTALDKLKMISDRIGNFLKTRENMYKEEKQKELMKTLESLHREFVQRIKDIKNDKASTEEAEEATLLTLTEQVQKTTDTPMETTTDTPMKTSGGFDPAKPSGQSGGRKTKKRSMKKFKKTRRGIRKPLFRY